MDKHTRAVARLIELTRKGSLKWTAVEGAQSETQYITEFDGEWIRIVRGSNKPALQILNKADHRPIYEFPPTPALYDLLSAIEYRVPGVKALIEKLASGS